MALIHADTHLTTPPPRPQLPWPMTDSLQCIGQDRPPISSPWALHGGHTSPPVVLSMKAV